MALTIVIAEAAHSERGSGHYGYDGSIPGDQLMTENHFNQEVRFHAWYNKPWVHIYRPVDPQCAEEIAVRAMQCVQNKHIGYSQPGRLGLYNALMKDPDPSHIKTNLECDCSSMVNSIVRVTYTTRGITPTVKGTEVTSQMEAAYTPMIPKYFTDVIKRVNLNTGEGLKRGDILLGAPATHTAIVCTVRNDTGYSTDPKYDVEVCNCETVTVRTGPGNNYGVLSSWPVLSCGNRVAVCDGENGWYYVRIGDKPYSFGWVPGDRVKAIPIKTGKVTTDLHLRTAPLTGKSIAVMKKGSLIDVITEVKASTGALWYGVKYNGLEGYASARYIKII